MIDVIRVFQAIIDQDHALDQLDHVILGDRTQWRHHRSIDMEPLVQLVTPHPLQIIPALVEQLAFKIFACVVQSRRVARTHPLIELQQRGFCNRLPVAQVPLRFHPNRAFDVPVIGVIVNFFVDFQEFLIGAFLDRRVFVEPILHCGQSAQQNGHRNCTLAIEFDREIIALASLELHPRPAIGDELG